MYKLEYNIPTFVNGLKSGIIKANNAVGIYVKKNMDNEVAVLTGNLKAHNKYKVSENGVTFSNDCEYAGFQEFGTKHQKGKPFFRKAIEEHRQEISNIYERSIPK